MIKKIMIILIVVAIIFVIIGFVNDQKQDELLESIDQVEINDGEQGQGTEDEGENIDDFQSYDIEIKRGEVNDSSKEITVNDYGLTFTGFALGKSHIAEFMDTDIEVYFKDTNLVGGRVVLYSATVDTGIEKLNTHLKTDDFLGADKNERISFHLINTSLGKEDGTSVMQAEGNLDFLGQSKSVQFPMTVTREGNKFTLGVDASIDLLEFGFDPEPLAKSEVRIEGNIEIELQI
jgi:polyisoprenoid-binding protein YceI